MIIITMDWKHLDKLSKNLNYVMTIGTNKEMIRDADPGFG